MPFLHSQEVFISPCYIVKLGAAMNVEDVDFESFLQSCEEEQRQQACVPSFPPSSSFEPGNLDDANMINFSSSLINLLEKQHAEVDQFLQLQNERLGESLFRQRERHIASLNKHWEQKMSMLLRMKDDQLDMLKMQYIKLYENLKKAEELKDAWKRIAYEKDVMISSLNRTLEQLSQQTHISTADALNGEHYCSGSSNEGKGEEIPTRGSYHVPTPCKCCCVCDACMLFLPCRHICACKVCVTSHAACPICASVKKETIEVLLV